MQKTVQNTFSSGEPNDAHIRDYHNYIRALNAIKPQTVQGQLPTPMQSHGNPWGGMPNFGDGVAAEKAKGDVLMALLGKLAGQRGGIQRDINGWDTSQGPNPNNPWAAGGLFSAPMESTQGGWYDPNASSKVFAGIRGEIPAAPDPRTQYYLSHWQAPTYPQVPDRNAWTPQIDYRQMTSLPIGPMGAKF
jgi:hypothetical protein